MPPLLATVTFPSTSGFVEDAIVNTFAIDADPAFDEAIDGLQILSPIADFYNTAVVPGVTIAGFLSARLSRAANAALVEVYDLSGHLDGTPHGSPVTAGTFTLGAAGSASGLPSEVALAMTLRGFGWQDAPVEVPDGNDPGSAVDRPKQRRTGKLYIGPFNTTALGAEVNGEVRPHGDLVTALLNQGEKLTDDLLANNHIWAVWSRADQGMYQISELQVDNAFDTQRRRGADATVRTTRTVVP